MISFTSDDPVPGGIGPSAVAIGKFDGIHVGHRSVLTLLKQQAAARGLSSVVVTFDRNPLAIVRPDLCPDPVVSNAQKLELLDDAGIDATLMLIFDERLAAEEARPWAERLVQELDVKLLIAGQDFRFGHRAQGNVALLQELGATFGFEVIAIDDVAGLGDRRASSTWVRELLDEGNIPLVTELLGRHPRLRSVVIHGDARGREMGFPTTNLDVSRMEGYIPTPGVYACWATVAGVRHPAAVSIGDNPTFDDVTELRVEAHLIDGDAGDLYDRVIELEIVDYVRPMYRFDSVEALTVALGNDVVRVREILS